MTARELIFCCILLGNAVVSCLYLLFGLVYIRRCEAKDEEKKEEKAELLQMKEEAAAEEDEEKKEEKAELLQMKEDEPAAEEDKAEEDKEETEVLQIKEKEESEEIADTKENKEETAGIEKKASAKTENIESEVNAEKKDAAEKQNAAENTEKKASVKSGGEEEQEEELPMRDGRLVYVMKFIIMLLCPVAGPVFFGVGHFLFLFVFRQDVNLDDVIFSKERVRTNDRADEERERNIAPLEEAIAVSDKESLRSLMLNIIKGDIRNSLAAISLALNSTDSETSHYAASVLQDELNNFRGNVQKVYREIEKEEDDETECEYHLIPYMNNVLEQKVFTEMEQKNMVNTFNEVGEILFHKNRQQFSSQYYEWMCLRLLDIKDFERMEKWCDRAADQYPDELSSYTCKLKLYFTAQNQEKFFETLDALKHSSIVIDRETLALIRTFS